jgi:hypothetical protein
LKGRKDGGLGPQRVHDFCFQGSDTMIRWGETRGFHVVRKIMGLLVKRPETADHHGGGSI